VVFSGGGTKRCSTSCERSDGSCKKSHGSPIKKAKRGPSHQSLKGKNYRKNQKKEKQRTEEIPKGVRHVKSGEKRDRPGKLKPNGPGNFTGNRELQRKGEGKFVFAKGGTKKNMATPGKSIKNQEKRPIGSCPHTKERQGNTCPGGGQKSSMFMTQTRKEDVFLPEKKTV